MSKVLLTAGYDRALHSVFVAESLRQAGFAPSLIIIAYPTSIARIRTIIRSRGLRSIISYITGKEIAIRDSPIRDALREIGVVKPSLKAWARQNGVPLVMVSDLNSQRAIQKVEALAPDVAAYTGGGILRASFLKAVGSPGLNAHSGHMPDVRGMNALEWSLLFRLPTGVTMHLIDEGIDTGQIVEWIDVLPQVGDTLATLRNRLIYTGAKAMVRLVLQALDGHLITESQKSIPQQRQCFVVAQGLLEVATLRLSQREGDRLTSS